MPLVDGGRRAVPPGYLHPAVVPTWATLLTLYLLVAVVSIVFYWRRRDMYPIKARVPLFAVISAVCCCLWMTFDSLDKILAESFPCELNIMSATLLAPSILACYAIRGFSLLFKFELTSSKLREISRATKYMMARADSARRPSVERPRPPSPRPPSTTGTAKSKMVSRFTFNRSNRSFHSHSQGSSNRSIPSPKSAERSQRAAASARSWKSTDKPTHSHSPRSIERTSGNGVITASIVLPFENDDRLPPRSASPSVVECSDLGDSRSPSPSPSVSPRAPSPPPRPHSPRRPPKPSSSGDPFYASSMHSASYSSHGPATGTASAAMNGGLHITPSNSNTQSATFSTNTVSTNTVSSDVQLLEEASRSGEHSPTARSRASSFSHYSQKSSVREWWHEHRHMSDFWGLVKIFGGFMAVNTVLFTVFAVLTTTDGCDVQRVANYSAIAVLAVYIAFMLAITVRLTSEGVDAFGFKSELRNTAIMSASMLVLWVALDVIPSASSWNSDKFPYRDLLTQTVTFAALSNTIIHPLVASLRTCGAGSGHSGAGKTFSVTYSRSERDFGSREDYGSGSRSRDEDADETQSVSADTAADYIPTSYSNFGVGSPIRQNHRSPFGEPESPSHGPIGAKFERHASRHNFRDTTKSNQVEMANQAHSSAPPTYISTGGASRTGTEEKEMSWGRAPPALGSISKSQGALFTSSTSHVSLGGGGDGDEVERTRGSTTGSKLANVLEHPPPEVVVAFSSSAAAPNSPSMRSPHSPLYDVSLRRLLSTEDGEEAFKDFLVAEFAVENLSFWSTVNAYRKLAESLPTRKQRSVARRVARRYLLDDALLQVNVAAHVSTPILEALGLIQEDERAQNAQVAAPWTALQIQFQQPQSQQQRAATMPTPLTAHEQMHLRQTSKQTVGSGRMPFGGNHRKGAAASRPQHHPQQVDASAEAILRNATLMGSLSSIHGHGGGGVVAAAETSSEDLLRLTRDHRNMGLEDPSVVLRLSSVSDDSGLRRVSTARLDDSYLHIFDLAQREVYRLMVSDSYQRFKQQPRYRDVAKRIIERSKRSSSPLAASGPAGGGGSAYRKRLSRHHRRDKTGDRDAVRVFANGEHRHAPRPPATPSPPPSAAASADREPSPSPRNGGGASTTSPSPPPQRPSKPSLPHRPSKPPSPTNRSSRGASIPTNRSYRGASTPTHRHSRGASIPTHRSSRGSSTPTHRSSRGASRLSRHAMKPTLTASTHSNSSGYGMPAIRAEQHVSV